MKYYKSMPMFLQLIISASLLLSTHIAHAQHQPFRNWTKVHSWMAAPWNGSDKPYQQMRGTIDNAISGGRKPQELVEFYKLPALEHPNDPKAQFRWAYAAYIAAKQTDYNQGEKILGSPRQALVLAPFPHSYEYARLIFLTMDYAKLGVTQLKSS